MELPKYNFDAALESFERSDYASVLELALPHAIQGDPDAQTMIALLYQGGLGVEQSALQAEQWLLKAAQQNHSVAWNNLGTLYASKLPELEHRWSHAAKCYERAKALGFDCADPYPPQSN
jgi:TPR repeat protein